MIFDIRTEDKAQETLERLTGIPFNKWEEELPREREFEYTEDFVESMIQNYGTRQLPSTYRELDYVFFHLTTSSDDCISIKRNGILDLKRAYECRDSELRNFLDIHKIRIDIQNRMLFYREREYDISYGQRPRNSLSEEYKCWSIGRKFYYDYTICGFLSVWQRSPYAGLVHRRPEILMDIDDLLGTNLSDEWERRCRPFEIVAKVTGKNICFQGFDDMPESEKVMTYMTMAYDVATCGCSEKILLLRNGIQIPPERILEIKPFQIWN